jgi:hypothetical protein
VFREAQALIEYRRSGLVEIRPLWICSGRVLFVCFVRRVSSLFVLWVYLYVSSCPVSSPLLYAAQYVL